MEDLLFHALADKHRRFILGLLRTRPMNVGEIRSQLSLTGATVSHHLDILKRADLVHTERRGRFIWYSINEPLFQQILTQLRGFFEPPMQPELSL